MSKRCEFTAVGPTTGNLVSHSNIKTRTRWQVNLQQKKYTIPELCLTLRLKLSARAIRTIDKQGGISTALRQAKPELLSKRLQMIQRQLVRN